MKILYIDFNQWITLSRIAIGKETKPNLLLVYRLLERKLRDEEIRIPLSLTHLLELATSSSDINRKLKLADTMLNFSQGYTIPPYTTMLRNEIDFAIMDRLFEHGNHKQRQEIQKMKMKIRSDHNKTEEFSYLGKGIPHLLGSTLKVTNKFTGEEIQDERVNQLINTLAAPKAFLDLITEKEFLNMSNKAKNEFREIADSYIKDTVHFSKMQQPQRNNSIRGYFLLKIGILDVIARKYKNWCNIFGFEFDMEKNVLFYHKGDNTKKLNAINSFIEKIPILEVLLSLSTYYFNHFERKITSNDLFDISFLSLAIPYSDIVICDKFFAVGCRKLQLDKIYDTSILYNLGGLEDLSK